MREGKGGRVRKKEATGSISSFSCGPRASHHPFTPPLHCSGTRGPWSAEAYEEGVLKASSGPTSVTFTEEGCRTALRTGEKGDQVARGGECLAHRSSPKVKAKGSSHQKEQEEDTEGDKEREVACFQGSWGSLGALGT